MKEIKTKKGNHKVVIYDDIEEMNIVRYHKFSQSMMQASIIGFGTGGLRDALMKIMRDIERGDNESAMLGIKNAFLSIKFSEETIDPSSNAFAVLIHSIDGEEREDISDDGMARTREIVECIFSVKERNSVLDTVKKKLTTTLRRIIPKATPSRKRKSTFGSGCS